MKKSLTERVDIVGTVNEQMYRLSVNLVYFGTVNTKHYYANNPHGISDPLWDLDSCVEKHCTITANSIFALAKIVANK